MVQPTFYMANDDQSIQNLQKQLGVLGRLDIRKRPNNKELEDDLLNALTQPENNGDLHLKLLLSESQQYSIDKTLV